MTRPARILILNFLATAIIALPQAHAQVKSRLSVGVVLPLSGPLGSFGAEVMRGIEFAMSELKERDADLGSRIEVNVEDSQSQSKLSDSLARKLVATRRADVLFGGVMSSTNYGLAKIANEVQKPLILATAAHSGLTATGPYIFRTCSSDDDQGRALAKYGFQNLQKKQAAIIFDKNSTYAKSIAMAFEKSWTSYGGKIALKKDYDDATNMRDLVRMVKKSGADVLLAPVNYPEAAALLEATKEEAAKFKILGTDSWDSPKLWSIANKSSLKGHFFAAQFSALDTNADSVAFVNAYKSKYSSDPTLFSAQGYDAMQVIFDAFKRARSNISSALVKAIPQSSGVAASGGAISIDAQRNARRPWKIMTTNTAAAAFVARVQADE